MTILAICWVLVGETCVFGTNEVLPDHFSCVMVKRIWLEKWAEEGVGEPEYIRCERKE